MGLYLSDLYGFTHGTRREYKSEHSFDVTRTHKFKAVFVTLFGCLLLIFENDSKSNS